MNRHISTAVEELARGDLAELSDRLSNAGLDVQLPAPGILRVGPLNSSTTKMRLLVSVGIHGDETGPIEILAEVLDEITRSPNELAVDLMIVVGNPEAIALGKRYVDVDLNRLFSDDGQDAAVTVESARANVIMQAATDFFMDAKCEKWHLDLHTAIRESAYPRFAIVPDVIEENGKQKLISWLGSAGVGAVVLNSKFAATFSAYTATKFSAISCTAEMGRVGALGENDLQSLSMTRDALRLLMRSAQTPANIEQPEIFEVVQELIKHSDEFKMVFDQATHNFASLEPGNVIARDRDKTYLVGVAKEYVVFPNPNVRVGQRAGLMVIPRVRT